MTEFSTAARVGQLRRALIMAPGLPSLCDADRSRLKAELEHLEELLRYAR